MKHPKTYAKFLVAALAAALTAAYPLLNDGNMSTQEMVMVALAAVGALGVYFVPNKPTGNPRRRQASRPHRSVPAGTAWPDATEPDETGRRPR